MGPRIILRGAIPLDSNIGGFGHRPLLRERTELAQLVCGCFCFPFVFPFCVVPFVLFSSFWSGLWWSGGTTGVTGGSTADTWLCCPSWVAFGAWAVVPPIFLWGFSVRFYRLSPGGTSGHLTCGTTGPRSGSTAARLRAYLYPTGRRVFSFSPSFPVASSLP